MLGLWLTLVRRPFLTLTVIVLFTGLFAGHLRHLEFDSSPSTLILSGSPENEYHRRMTRVFGSDQVLLVGISAEDVLDLEMLGAIRNLTYEFESIPGVKRVLSLTNLSDVRGAEDEVSIAPLVPEEPGALDREMLRARLLANPLYQRSLVSADFRMTSLAVVLEDFEPGEALSRTREATRKVRAAVEKTRWQHPPIIGGLPEMELEGTENMIRDLWVFTPLTVIVIVGILAVSFRSLHGVLIPLAVCGFAVSWTLGIMVLSRHPLNVATLVLPPLLISNGCSYGIHFLAQYHRILAQAYTRKSILDRESHASVVRETLRFTHAAIFVSAVTTMAGFGSLALNRIPAIRDLGLFAALGVLLSYLFCVSVSPAVLVLLRAPRSASAASQPGRLTILMEKLASFDLRRRRRIHFLTLAACACALWGISRIEARTNYLAYFPESAPVARAAQKFHEMLAGIAPLSIIIEAPEPVTDPAVLKAVQGVQQKLAATPGIDLTLSLVDVLKMLNRAFHSEDPRHFTLPRDSETVRELVEFAESDPRGFTADFLSEDHRLLRIFVRTHLFDSGEVKNVLDLIQREGARLLPPGATVHATGTLVLMNQTSDRVAGEQARSLALSLLLVGCVVTLLFRSWKVGMLALIPPGIPILLFFGLLGWAGLPLNVNTSVIACIAIGIAVDNCVHYLMHFQRNSRLGLARAEAARHSLADAGGAMISATAALTLGFVIFGLSQFAPVVQFGFLAAFIMVTNLAAGIFLLPSLMPQARQVTT